jgi:hypothetical protein
MFLGSKFVYVSSGDEEETVVTGNVSSEEEVCDEKDDGEVCIYFITLLFMRIKCKTTIYLVINTKLFYF